MPARAGRWLQVAGGVGGTLHLTWPAAKERVSVFQALTFTGDGTWQAVGQVGPFAGALGEAFIAPKSANEIYRVEARVP